MPFNQFCRIHPHASFGRVNRTLLRAAGIGLTALTIAVTAAAPITTGPLAPSAAQAAPTGIAVIIGQWSEMIQATSGEFDVPWQVVASIMVIESGGNPDAVNRKSGATGLLQIRENLWPDQVARIAPDGDLRDPETNLRVGSAILADLYSEWGSWEQAAAAYIGAIDAEGNVTSAKDDDGRTGADYMAGFQRQLSDLGYYGLPMAAQEDLLSIALSALGTPYVWGGESYEEGGFDCSGLILWAYNQVGKSVPRTADEQWNATQRIAPADVQVGDLIFFYNTYTLPGSDNTRVGMGEQKVITHNGIYAGNGLMLHAPKEGDYVRLVSLDDPYWREHLAGYGRVT